jgi:hypothetical protein
MATNQTGTMTKKTSKGPRQYGSLRAAEYGSPQLALYENLPFAATPSFKEDEDFSYKDSSAPAAGTGAKKAGPSALDRFTRQLQAMLTGGSYGKPYDNLQESLANLNQKASGTINSSMDALKAALQGQANPYANFKAQSTQVTPELSQLLASQGVPTTPLQQMAAATQAQNTGQATAFQNLVGSLGTIYGANQAGQISDVDAQRANLQNMLTQQTQGMGAQLAEKKQGRQSELLTMLLSSLAKGGRPNAGRLF